MSVGGVVARAFVLFSVLSVSCSSDSTDSKRTCEPEHEALLTALRESAGPCVDTSECAYFPAWSIPTEAEYCNGNWPVLRSTMGALDERNEAMNDCQVATKTVPANGACGLGTPLPICVDGQCVIPKRF